MSNSVIKLGLMFGLFLAVAEASTSLQASENAESKTYRVCSAQWISNIRVLRDYENNVPVERSLRPNSEMLYNGAREHGEYAAYVAVALEYFKCARAVRQHGVDEASPFRACAMVSAISSGAVNRINNGEPLDEVRESVPEQFKESVDLIGMLHEQTSPLEAIKSVVGIVEECLDRFFDQ